MRAGGRLLASVRRYTRFVRFGKWTLWILAAGMVALLGVLSWINTGEGGARLVFTGAKTSDTGEAVMLKPHYQGVDAKDQPFSVTAETATQKDADTVALSRLHADMSFDTGRWAALAANEGLLRLNAKKLDLAGNVDMFYDGGYEMRTQLARVDMAAGRVDGPSRVEGQGPSIQLEAGRFEVLDRGRMIRFEEDVKVKIFLEGK